MVGVAVKLTLVPEQMVLPVALEVIVTEGVTLELTVVVIDEELAVAVLAQLALEVSTTATASLFERPVVV